MSRTPYNKQNRRKYENEPDVFEIEEMRESEERHYLLDEDDPEEWYEEAFDCIMNLFDEILDAEDDTEVDECIVNARLA